MIDFEKLEKIVAYFKCVEPLEIDQSNGVYNVDASCGCCVGAHIAHMESGINFSDGIDALFAAVFGHPRNCERETAEKQSYLLGRLRVHGSGKMAPFGGEPWDNPPHIVFQRLIDELREEQAKA